MFFFNISILVTSSLYAWTVYYNGVMHAKYKSVLRLPMDNKEVGLSVFSSAGSPLSIVI